MRMAGTESEVKVRVGRPEAARARLQACGATLARARHFEDNLLLDDARGSLVAAGLVLRVRRTQGSPDGGGEAQLTFKGPRRVEGGIKTREEIELGVSDADALQLVLERLGYRPGFRYQKYRETWRLGPVEVVIDETPIGCFLEIEGPLEAIPAAAERLGYGAQDYVLEPYVALFRAAGGHGDMVFP